MAEVKAIGEKLEWKEDVKCSSCKTEFVVSPKDIVYAVDNTISCGPIAEVICPECGQHVVLRGVPKHIVAQFEEKVKVASGKKDRNYLIIAIIAIIAAGALLILGAPISVAVIIACVLLGFGYFTRATSIATS